MAQYLAEVYLSRIGAGDLDAVVVRAHAAATALTNEGVPVRYVRSIFVPADETWLLLYDGPNATAVRDAIARAGIHCERVLEAETYP